MLCERALTYVRQRIAGDKGARIQQTLEETTLSYFDNKKEEEKEFQKTLTAVIYFFTVTLICIGVLLWLS